MNLRLDLLPGDPLAGASSSLLSILGGVDLHGLAGIKVVKYSKGAYFWGSIKSIYVVTSCKGELQLSCLQY